MSMDTLFVFTDQALGMWVPTLAGRKHVIHCHDFLALRSALNEISENTTSSTGKLYQRLILRGLQKGKNFICVSQNTKKDLLRFIKNKSINALVVYNGFHQPFFPIPKQEARAGLSELIKIDLNQGYLLHIGGNLWYKNRRGVIEIYDTWRAKTRQDLPLLMVGEPPDPTLQHRHKQSDFSSDIHWLSDISDDAIRLAYAGASVFIFPSLGEGFGWPIAEAMASGTAVVVTNEAPMTEVAGDAGFLIPRMPNEPAQLTTWCNASADVIENILKLPPESAAEVTARGVENTRRFGTRQTLDEIEKIYERIIAPSRS